MSTDVAVAFGTLRIPSAPTKEMEEAFENATVGRTVVQAVARDAKGNESPDRACLRQLGHHSGTKQFSVQQKESAVYWRRIDEEAI